MYPVSTATTRKAPSPEVRASVRDLLTASEAYHQQDPDTRRAIAASLVRICDTALALTKDEAALPGAQAMAMEDAPPGQHADHVRDQPVLAQAQNAGSEFSGVAASRVADTTRQVLNAVSFPRFVTDLINGVFKSLNDSNQQQLHSYVELIQNVAASTEGFAEANVGLSGARSWLADKFPANFVITGAESDDFSTPASQMTPEERAEAQAERDAATRLSLRPGASMPSEAAMRTAFGLGPQDSVPSGDPESLVPLARASMARNRQQMLSTMVMMGLQRIVVESGRLNASMRFHIDTHSAAANDHASSFDERNDTTIGVGAKFGPWGVEGKMQNTIAYVSSDRSQTTEEMNTSVDLNSSVELLFKTDYVALDRLAGGPAQERIRVNSLNPETELRLASSDAQARRTAQGTSESARSAQMAERVRMPTQGAAVPANAPGGTGVAAPAAAPPRPAAGTPAAGTPAAGTPAAGAPAAGAPARPAAGAPARPAAAA